MGCSLFRVVSVSIGLIPILSHGFAIYLLSTTLPMITEIRSNMASHTEERKKKFIDQAKLFKLSLGVSIARDLLAILALAVAITLTVFSILNLPITLAISLGIGLGIFFIISLAISARTLAAVNTFIKELNS